MLEVLSLAAAGALDEALAHTPTLHEDRFGLLEQGLQMFLLELQSALHDSRTAMAALKSAHDEIEDKLATIAGQQRAIHELSAPLLDVWDGVLAAPLVGEIDQTRALELTEKLLARVVASRTRWVLLDLTGLREVETGTAEHLLGLARAVRLVGGRCVLTGIHPRTAQTFVELGVHLDLVAFPSLREGLRHCLAADPRVRR